MSTKPKHALQAAAIVLVFMMTASSIASATDLQTSGSPLQAQPVSLTPTHTVSAKVPVQTPQQTAEELRQQRLARQKTEARKRRARILAGKDGVAIIKLVASENKCTSQEIKMLLYVAKHESGYRVHARSRSGKYLGLFQLGPHLGSKAKRMDPAWNTKRAIRYMRGRYGSVAKAYRFKRAHGWY